MLSELEIDSELGVVSLEDGVKEVMLCSLLAGMDSEVCSWLEEVMDSDETLSASLVGMMLVVSDMLSASLVGVSLDELASAGVPTQEESASIDNSKKAVCFFFKKKGFIYVPPKDIGFMVILLH